MPHAAPAGAQLAPSVAKRARPDGSPLPSWLQATPVRCATGARGAAAPAAAATPGGAAGGAEMELMALRPRRLATTPVRDVR